MQAYEGCFGGSGDAKLASVDLQIGEAANDKRINKLLSHDTL